MVFCMVISLLFAGTMVFAADAPINKYPSADNVLFNQEQIDDLDVLYERAVKGITDYPVRQGVKATLTDDNGNMVNLPIISTTQHLRDTKLPDQTIKAEYATTFFAVVPLGSGQENDHGYDSSISVKAYSTIYWSINDGKHLLTRVSGGWTILDSLVSISNRSVTMSTNGWLKLGSPTGYIQQVTTKYPTGNTFDYTTPTSWVPVTMTGGTPKCSLGASQQVTLHRTTETWTFVYSHNLLF